MFSCGDEVVDNPIGRGQPVVVQRSPDPGFGLNSYLQWATLRPELFPELASHDEEAVLLTRANQSLVFIPS